MSLKEMREMLQGNGVSSALEQNRISLDRVLEGMDDRTAALYGQYVWNVLVLDGPDGLEKIHIVQTYPSENPACWEEWFTIGEEVHHHIYLLEPKPGFDQTLDCPPDDPGHPDALCGKTWSFCMDTDVRAYLSRDETLT